MRSVLPLAFLAPEVVKAALDGRLPNSCSVSRLTANSLPSWPEQKRSLGLGEVLDPPMAENVGTTAD